ncbi:DUF5133 domain-containing protein [Actinacidiphila guanduensis]|jgi:hypothetical protein|uniref:DUF5133 domain-containing protein n=1 Tax=Actinacidiphila guanduensis TaxID=310781 RepID=A0A1G9VXH5_9ACTN|nr:DUF5133 domain-containing protein [Actinacidiphila guanduensis]SDM76954.1 protein of unknown function [Actinacidiphila guanduensis]
MLMAHPTVLRKLVERYQALSALADEPGTTAEGVRPEVRQQLQDTVYTLCVSTGTREIGAALAAARAHIDQAAFAQDAAAGESAA